MPARSAFSVPISGEASRLLRRLAKDPSVLLARLRDGDPLGLIPACAARVRERALLIDHSRLLDRTTAVVALTASYSGVLLEEALSSDAGPTADERTEAWIGECVDEAIDQLLNQDREEEIQGLPGDGDDPRYTFLLEGLGVEPCGARAAAVEFHALPFRTRKAFITLMDGASLQRCVDEGLGDLDQVAWEVRRALAALGHWELAEHEKLPEHGKLAAPEEETDTP